MTKEVTDKKIRTFIGKRILLQQAVFETVANAKDSVTITVESTGDKDVLFDLGNGVKLSIDKEDNEYVKGDKITLDVDRVVIAEELKPYVKRVSNKGASPARERYE